MIQDSRLNKILEYFLVANEYITPAKLAELFSMSERTIRNDITRLNLELKRYHSSIIYKRKEGYYLKVSDVSTLPILEQLVKINTGNLETADDRIRLLIFTLIYEDRYLSMDELADKVYVSINTLLNYLKSIRQTLTKYKLRLKSKSNVGYMILGEEIDKRRCIIDLLSSDQEQFSLKFSTMQIEVLSEETIYAIRDIMILFNQENNLSFSDYNLKNLILHIALSISRIQNGQMLEEYQIPNFEVITSLLEPFIKKIEEHFEISFSDAEKSYIYSHYISYTNELLSYEFNTQPVLRLVEKILYYIYKSYHIDLRMDSVLNEDLCRHLQSLLETHYFNLNIKNPLLETIKNNYIFAFEVTKTAILQALEKEQFHFNDDEIGYITLHIGAAIERYFNSQGFSRQKVLIIYSYGFSEASFLISRLSILFKDILEIVGHYPSHQLTLDNLRNADFIISTVPLKVDISIPVVLVDILLRPKDIENISKVFTRKTEKPISNFINLFSQNLFMVSQSTDKDEIIHKMCAMLYEDGHIFREYEQSLMEREEKISTAMGNILAIPHPMGIYSHQSRIAVCLLDKPVKWSKDSTVQIVFMLAISDDHHNDMQALYDIFVSIINDSHIQHSILKSRNLQEFLLVLMNELKE